jgi:hypothetical protein
LIGLIGLSGQNPIFESQIVPDAAERRRNAISCFDSQARTLHASWMASEFGAQRELIGAVPMELSQDYHRR